MKNDTIKMLREQVQRDEFLSKDDQIQILSDLLRANRRIQAAKRAGFLAHEPPANGAAKPDGARLDR